MTTQTRQLLSYPLLWGSAEALPHYSDGALDLHLKNWRSAMNWDAIGAVGELIGSLTVVITVVYLAVQLRQSSRVAISVSTNQSRTAVTDVISAISSNTDAVKTYTTGLREREDLEMHERVRFDLIIYQQLRVIETIFLEYQEGLMPEEVWESQWHGERSILRTKGGRDSWEAQKTFVARSFRNWVDRNLDHD